VAGGGVGASCEQALGVGSHAHRVWRARVRMVTASSKWVLYRPMVRSSGAETFRNLHFEPALLWTDPVRVMVRPEVRNGPCRVRFGLPVSPTRCGRHLSATNRGRSPTDRYEADSRPESKPRPNFYLASLEWHPSDRRRTNRTSRPSADASSHGWPRRGLR
jgi:hypothetical protein